MNRYSQISLFRGPRNPVAPWKMVALIWNPLAVLLTGYLVYQAGREWLFEDYGAQAPAIVTACEMMPRRGGAIPNVHYTYGIGNELIKGQDTSGGGNCKDYYVIGRRITVEYLTTDPAQSRPLKIYYTRWQTILMVTLPVLCIVPLIATAFAYVVRFFRHP